MRAALLLAALAASACGGDSARSVEVTEAPADAFTGRPPTAPPDTSVLDLVRLDSLRRDSLRADSLRADSVRQSEPVSPAAPDFRAFWPRFQAAVREGRPAVARLAAFSDGLERSAFDGHLFEAVFGSEPFRSRVLALGPRAFERDGTRRAVTVLVGYDTDGEVVPEDEAETESAVTLAFDVVDGAYRLVALRLAG